MIRPRSLPCRSAAAARIWSCLLLVLLLGCAGSDDPAEAAPPGASGDQPPVARLEVVPATGWAGLTMFHFDANASSDDLTPPGQLMRRWDFDGDGQWDTRWQRGGRMGRTFDQPGTLRARLAVRDAAGQIDSTIAAAVEIVPACPPPDFALVDDNPHSPGHGEVFRLSDHRGEPVLAWVATISK